MQSELQAAIARIDSDSPRLDAEVLLAHSLNKPRSHLLAWPDKVIQPSALQQFNQLIQKRIDGQPISYLTGTREFWSMNLTVTPDVLIPRPETELLVETALARLSDVDSQAADLGTGSGAIAIALAKERPNWQITATDQSQAALRIAAANAAQQNLGNIEFRHSDWLESLADKRFDLIISNPPYIAATDPHLDQGDVRFEPDQALASGVDGLDDIKKIIAQSPAHLKPNAWLMLEHGYNQSSAVQKLLEGTPQHNMENCQQYTCIESLADLSGQSRVTVAQLSSQP
ncbi:MAG TPA: peptide chain release factor N(5)-glutamine methyltransferase [Gammaproteobacteria bacterium]|nr:peptide chain release factor N(5)-glutamine methyltransferase [Gammaproteobacteria bacterium]